MVLAEASSDFFTRFGVGTLMALSLVREPQLKKSFYLFTSIVSAVLIAVGICLGGWVLPDGYLLLSLPFILGFYTLVAIDRGGAARLSLLVAIVLGLIGVLGNLASAAGGLGLAPLPQLLLALNLMASLYLGGIVLCTLLLGHWYLISPKLSFEPLVRGALLFFWAVWLRLAILSAILIAFGWTQGMEGKIFLDRLLLWDNFGMFFLLRIFWGILGPLVLSFMIYKTAQIQSNQSATGILYVALVFVLIGELIADYLWALARIPV